MADPDKLEEDIEDLLEIGGARDADETEAKEGTVAEADGAEDSARKRKGRRMLPRVFGLVWRRKWIGLFIMLPLGALIALGITLHSGYLEKQKVKPLPLSGKAVSLESLKEESLSPFFIPLTADDNRRMVRVDLSVIWSALASIKYKKNEIRIRDRMYSLLRRLARDTRNSNNPFDLLENKLKGILRDSLGIYNLEVKVREINYF